MKIDSYCQRQNCSPLKCTFQRCIDRVDIARRCSARGVKQQWYGKNKSSYTQLSCTYLALARLSCKILKIKWDDISQKKSNIIIPHNMCHSYNYLAWTIPRRFSIAVMYNSSWFSRKYLNCFHQMADFRLKYLKFVVDWSSIHLIARLLQFHDSVLSTVLRIPTTVCLIRHQCFLILYFIILLNTSGWGNCVPNLPFV